MSPEANKRAAIELFARFSASDVDGVLGAMTDKRRIGRLFHRMLERLQDGLEMSVKSAIAEGDKVAVEVQSRGQLINGRLYQQEYHFLMEFRDGKICAVREYLDTQHAHAVWFEPPANG